METIIEIILETVFGIINPKVPRWIDIAAITILFGLMEFVFIAMAVLVFAQSWLIAGIVCIVICVAVIFAYIYVLRNLDAVKEKKKAKNIAKGTKNCFK